MATSTTRPRRRRLITTLLAFAVLAGGVFFAVRTIWRATQEHVGYDHCDVAQYQLDPDQASVAATMVGAVRRFRPALPDRAAVLVLAAGLQESKLRNLPPGAGDRDSVGVLQQRPSQGWGNGRASALTDVGEATREFLAHLVKVPQWQTLPLATAVQAVQVSADGSAYAGHEAEASALADALTGRKPAAITCSFAAPTVVASTGTVAQLLRKELPVNPPATTAAAVTVPGASWQTAAWLVAQADRLGIERVDHAKRTWTRTGGWRDSAAPSSSVVATMFRRAASS
jgi:hypothetical protein